jgi:hypothetical protein
VKVFIAALGWAMVSPRPQIRATRSSGAQRDTDAYAEGVAISADEAATCPDRKTSSGLSSESPDTAGTITVLKSESAFAD